MKRLVVRWVALLVAVAVLGLVMVRLGEWQLHRLTARRANNAYVRTNEAKAIQPFPGVLSTSYTVQDSDEWQRIRVTGTYDAAHQFQAMERSLGDGEDGTTGTEIVTPLRTASGLSVLVDRGLLPRPAGALDPRVLPTPPTGTVTVVGYVHRDERGKPSALVPVNHRMSLISAGYLGQQLPYPIVDGYLTLISSEPSQSGGMVPIPTPSLSEGPHLSYAVQWFMFTAIAVGGAAMLIRGDLRERRRRLDPDYQDWDDEEWDDWDDDEDADPAPVAAPAAASDAGSHAATVTSTQED